MPASDHGLKDGQGERQDAKRVTTKHTKDTKRPERWRLSRRRSPFRQEVNGKWEMGNEMENGEWRMKITKCPAPQRSVSLMFNHRHGPKAQHRVPRLDCLVPHRQPTSGCILFVYFHRRSTFVFFVCFVVKDAALPVGEVLG